MLCPYFCTVNDFCMCRHITIRRRKASPLKTACSVPCNMCKAFLFRGVKYGQKEWKWKFIQITAAPDNRKCHIWKKAGVKICCSVLLDTHRGQTVAKTVNERDGERETHIKRHITKFSFSFQQPFCFPQVPPAFFFWLFMAHDRSFTSIVLVNNLLN